MLGRKKSILLASLTLLLFGSCTPGVLNLHGVGYQSLNTKIPQPPRNEPIRDNAKILVTYAFNSDGKMGVFIKNLTNNIMVVDQEKSFLIDGNGMSRSYYDPNLRTSSTTTYSSETNSSSFNWGALANALGIGGPLGSLMGGYGTGHSTTQGTAQTNSVTIVDQRQVNIGPKGAIKLSKNYKITGLGCDVKSDNLVKAKYNYETSPLKFSVCIYYSFDEGANFQKLVTDFYLSGYNYSTVSKDNPANNALRSFVKDDSELLSEPWYMVYFPNNLGSGDYDSNFFTYTPSSHIYDNFIQGIIFDIQ